MLCLNHYLNRCTGRFSTPEIRKAFFVDVKAIEEVHCRGSHWTQSHVMVAHVPDALKFPELIRLTVLYEEH